MYIYTYVMILKAWGSRVSNKRILIYLTHYSGNRCEYLISVKISIRNSDDDFTHFRHASSTSLANYCRGCVHNCLWMNAQAATTLALKEGWGGKTIVRRNFSESERTRFYDERSNERQRFTGMAQERPCFQSSTIKLPPVGYKFHEITRNDTGLSMRAVIQTTERSYRACLVLDFSLSSFFSLRTLLDAQALPR